MGCFLNVFMVFVVEYVIIVFRSLKPHDSNPVSSLQLGLTAAFRPYLLYVLLYSSLIVSDHVISSSYANNTMSPNIEVERIKPEKGNMALLSRQYTL